MSKLIAIVALLTSLSSLANAQSATPAIQAQTAVTDDVTIPVVHVSKRTMVENHVSVDGIDYQTTAAISRVPPLRRLTLPLPPMIGTFR